MTGIKIVRAFSNSSYRGAVECIAKDRINFSQRALLEARVRLGAKQTAKMIALNDAVLSRGELSRLVLLCTPNQRLRGDFGETFSLPNKMASLKIGG